MVLDKLSASAYRLRVAEGLNFLSVLGGQQVFEHTLVLNSGDAPQTDPVHRAERARHPVLGATVPDQRLGADVSLLSAAPEMVYLSALVWDGDALLVRLVQMAGDSV